MNAGRSPLFVLQKDCRVITNLVIQQVSAVGMQALCSFDLDAVRSLDRTTSCPTHQRSDCTCQFVVLLILGMGWGPLTMILEGMNQHTAIYLETGQGAEDEQVDSLLISTLHSAFFSNTCQ